MITALHCDASQGTNNLTIPLHTHYVPFGRSTNLATEQLVGSIVICEYTRKVTEGYST